MFGFRLSLLILVCIPLGLKGQAEEWASRYSAAKTPDARLEQAFEIAKLNLGQNPDTALKYLQLALQDSSRAAQKKPVGNCLNALSVYYYYQGDFSATERNAGRAVEIFQKLGDTVSIVKARKNHALGLEGLGAYEDALEEYHQVLQAQRKMGDPVLIGGTLNDIGNVYIRTENYQQSLRYLREGLIVVQDVAGGESVRANLLNAIGVNFNERGMNDSAYHYLQQSYLIHKQLGSSPAAMNVLNNLCNCFQDDRQNPAYPACFDELVKMQVAFGDLQGAFRSYVNLAIAYQLADKLPKAVTMIDSASLNERLVQDPPLLLGYFLAKSNILAETGRYADAYKARLRYEELNKEVFYAEKERALQEMDARYDNEKKLQDIALLSAKDQNNQLVISRQFWAIVSMVSILLIGVLVFFQYRSRQALARQAELHRMREEERIRIARDMHDDLGSGLTRISLLGQKAKYMAGAGQHSEAVVELDVIMRESRELTKNLKEIIWALNPENDTLPELVSKIRNHAFEVQDLARFELIFDFPEEVPEMPVSAGVRKNVFLIVKESLNNLMKHAAATRVTLGLRAKGTTLDLWIEDNGRGFDLNTENSGNGLYNMRQRAEWAGAKFSMTSAPDKGTRIDISEIPFGNTTKV